jgi:hypothetical protein
MYYSMPAEPASPSATGRPASGLYMTPKAGQEAIYYAEQLQAFRAHATGGSILLNSEQATYANAIDHYDNTNGNGDQLYAPTEQVLGGQRVGVDTTAC